MTTTTNPRTTQRPRRTEGLEAGELTRKRRHHPLIVAMVDEHPEWKPWIERLK